MVKSFWLMVPCLWSWGSCAQDAILLPGRHTRVIT